MSKGYVIFTEVVTDQQRYDAYAEKALPTLERFGGRPLVIDDNPDVIEGQWHGTRTVILEFDSVKAARDWYHSSDYQAIAGERHAAAEANAAIVEEFQMPGN